MIAVMTRRFGPDLCYAAAARKTARRLTRHYDQYLAPASLTVTQFGILALLDHRGPITVSALSESLVMERTSLLRTLRPLEAAGFVVSRVQDKGRAYEVRLTQAGETKLREAEPLWRQAQSAFENLVGVDVAVRLRDEALLAAT
jgi:DNA-binding MarR family transcriptional regulator